MGKKILFLTTQKLLPSNYGGAIYSLGVIKYIASIGAKIDLISFTEGTDYTEKEKKELNKFCSNIHVVKHKWKNVKLNFSFKYSNSIRKYIRKDMKVIVDELYEKNRYDIVIYDHLQMAEYVGGMSKSKSILINHNVESKVWRNYLTTCSKVLRPIIKRNAIKIYEYEKDVIGRFSKVIVLTNVDKDELLKMNSSSDIVVMRPYMPMNRIKNDSEILNISKSILFVGSYSWYPNQKAADFLMCKLMPLLREKHQDIKLYLVGKDPTEEMLKLSKAYEDIIVTGKVEDLDYYYRECDIMVNAIEDGSGINIKVVEAMGKGIPIISSNYGLRGFDNSKNIAIEYTNEYDCADKISRLFNNPHQLIRIRENATSYYNELMQPSKEIEELFK